MNIGIVLSGGMAKGAYEIGALRAISERIDKKDIKCISGASIGALNAYAYVTDRLDRAEKMYLDLCADESESRLFLNQVLRSKTLQRDIKGICNKEDVVDKEFFITLLDIRNRTIEYRNVCREKGNVMRELLKASVAWPICNKPVVIDDRIYYDGAFADYIPIYPLMDKNLDLIICIYFDEEIYQFENKAFDSKVLKIVFPANSNIKDSLVFTTHDIKRNIEQGYKRTDMLLSRVLTENATKSDIRRRIARMNGKKSRKLRVTVDMLASNLNKVFQKIIKREIEV